MAARSEPGLLPAPHAAAINPPITPTEDTSHRNGPDYKKFPLLINDQPLDNFSPLGAPDPQKQWVMVAVLLVLSALQGATWGALRASERTLGGFCDYDVINSRQNGSIGAAPTLCTCSGLFQGISLCLFAPLGGILMDKGNFRNVNLQVATIGLCVAGVLVVVAASTVSIQDIHFRRVNRIAFDVPLDPRATELDVSLLVGPGNSVQVDLTEKYFPVKNSSKTGGGTAPSGANHLDGLGWCGIIVAAIALAAFRPLPSLLIADQTPVSQLKGTLIAWGFVTFRFGEILCMSVTDAALEVGGAGMVTAVAGLTCILLLLLLNRHIVPAEPDQWGTDHGVGGGGGGGSVSAPSRASDTAEGPSFPFASILSAMASKPALRVFALALLWRILLQSGLAWTKQATAMDDSLCFEGNSTAVSPFDRPSAPYALPPSHATSPADCIKVSSQVAPVAGTVLGLFVVISLQSGGFKAMACLGPAHFSSWPLDRFRLAASLLAAALSLSTVLQLAVHAHPHRVHVLWQVPQYAILSAADVLLLTAGLEYAYTVSAQSVRARATAIFLSFQGLGILCGLGLEAMTSTWTLLAQLLFFALSALISVTLHTR